MRHFNLFLALLLLGCGRTPDDLGRWEPQASGGAAGGDEAVPDGEPQGSSGGNGSTTPDGAGGVGSGGHGSASGGGSTGGHGSSTGAGPDDAGDDGAGVGGTPGGHGAGGSTGVGGGGGDELSAAPPIEGCTTDLASGISLTEVAFYQAVKVPVMVDMVPVEGSAELVAGRGAYVRVFVEPDPGWAARELGVRLTLDPGTSVPVIRDTKKVVLGESTDASPPSSFNFFIEPELVTGELRFAVEMFECDTPSGSPGHARYPETGRAVLRPRATGALKVALVPILYGPDGSDRLPDLSTDQLDLYRGLLEAMFPVTGVELSVRKPVRTLMELGSGSSWNSTLDALRSLRVADAPPDDVYYYGLIEPAATFEEYCGWSCITGIGYVSPSWATSYRVALGLGYTGQSSGFTLAHELGHNHGRDHAPCGTTGDPDYPHKNGIVGVWGYDSWRQLLLGPGHGDIMGYCRPQWISDYTYQALLERVSTVNTSAFAQHFVTPTQRWWTLLVDETGARWGLPDPEPKHPHGDPLVAQVYDAAGAEVAEVTAYRTEIADSGASSILVPEPRGDWAWIRVSGFVHSFAAPVTVIPLR